MSNFLFNTFTKPRIVRKLENFLLLHGSCAPMRLEGEAYEHALVAEWSIAAITFSFKVGDINSDSLTATEKLKMAVVGMVFCDVITQKLKMPLELAFLALIIQLTTKDALRDAGLSDSVDESAIGDAVSRKVHQMMYLCNNVVTNLQRDNTVVLQGLAGCARAFFDDNLAHQALAAAAVVDYIRPKSSN